MQITKTGKYITRDGSLVHVVAIVDVKYYPVIAYQIRTTKNGATYTMAFSCGVDGRHYVTLDDDMDIVAEWTE